VALGKLPHIILNDPPETSLYTTTSLARGGKTRPSRDRIPHGQYLQGQFNLAWQQAEEEQHAVSHSTRSGIYLEFKSDPDSELNLKSLENLPKRIRLLNVREEVETGGDEGAEKIVMLATIFVPHAEKNFFLEKLEKYLDENTSKGKPRNAELVDRISAIRKAILDSFWCDMAELLPADDPEWVEVWLSGDKEEVILDFEGLLSELEIHFRAGYIKFPERAVKVVFANRSQLEELTDLSDHIAEYRKAKSTAAYWTELTNRDQADWVENLLGRCSVDGETRSSVCILDEGVNNGHPLLQPVLSDDDCQAVDQSWGSEDHNQHGHGTSMAGLAAYGDLAGALESTEQIELTHRLESVKILPRPPEQNDPNLWGYITSQAISLAEIKAPDRQRSICMAVTAEDTRDRGRPSSWSAALDQLSSGAGDDTRRLIIVSAGNTTDISEAAKQYPDIQLTDSVHDPAQSWNSLTVGAYTQLDQITDSTLAGYKPVAPVNGLSPFSTTSAMWEENKWPVKPELVLEGGNLAIDDTGFPTECDDLSLLSTFHDPQTAHFSYFNMTSAATAQLSWMAGKLQALYPEFWPETIRALLVHSADWPETLKRQFTDDDKKTSYKRLLSICGYGVPSLERVMYSAQNSLTLIAQSTLQPYDKKLKGGGYRTRDMHLHELPWPTDVLLNLPDDTKVNMRVTLSYFVEPGPGEIGWKDRYRYASHALRFELNSPGESKSEFAKRVNKAARNADEQKPETKSPSDHWRLGSQARDRGSIHSDIWQGTAADLADSNLIAVSPTIGWWRERSYLERWDRKTRYALVVSIDSPDESIDVYTPVAVQVGVPVAVEIPI